MRKRHNNCKILLVMILLGLRTSLFAEGTLDELLRNWSSGTAYLLPAGRAEMGLFQPLRYGLNDAVEFSTHPLLCMQIPNLSLKWSHVFSARFVMATRHSIYYPTPLLRTLAREGIGGMISPEFHIPHMISINNEVLVSKFAIDGHLFTGKVGINFAIKSAELDERTTIDLPLLFPRLAVYYNGYGLRFGGDLQGKIIRRWNYLVDTDFFYFPGASENMAFEHKGLLLWTKSRRFQLCVGYKLSYSEYPFGTQWHLLGPIFDLQWARQLRGKSKYP